MSFGSGPFGTTGFGAPVADLPSEQRTSLTSSRAIDPETGRYVTDERGGFAGMDDVAQRVYMLVCFEVAEPPIIDARFQSEMRARITKALRPLTTGPRPTIQIEAINVSDDGRQTTRKEVVYMNLLTNTRQTVDAR